MKDISMIGFIALLLFFITSCEGQKTNTIQNNLPSTSKNGIVGGPFENGEFMYIDMPETINSSDTSAGWFQHGQKLLITGTIYKMDGKTPAPNVILYYYHTDINGLYTPKENIDKRVARHGYIRGWVRSDENGRYAIYTVRPAPYPNSNEPAHIHPAIKEPGIDKEYYLDAFVFDDDILLTGAKRKALLNRGGSGVLRVLKSGDLQIAEHNIILGLNIPNYPISSNIGIQSGQNIGEDVFSFTPYHAWGPDKGKKSCPVCKYGRYHGILYFVGNNPNWEDIENWLVFLEEESIKRKKYLKVYFVYGNEKDFQKEKRIKKLEDLGGKLNLENIALTFTPSFADIESEVFLNKINPEVSNTIVIYKNRNIVDKYINFPSNQNNFIKISTRLDETKNEYFNLEEPRSKD